MPEQFALPNDRRATLKTFPGGTSVRYVVSWSVSTSGRPSSLELSFGSGEAIDSPAYLSIKSKNGDELSELTEKVTAAHLGGLTQLGKDFAKEPTRFISGPPFEVVGFIKDILTENADALLESKAAGVFGPRVAPDAKAELS